MNTLVALVSVLIFALDILKWTIIIQAILSWLVVFNVVSPRSGPVAQIMGGLERFLEPIYRPFRRVIPDLGGVDLAPIAVILVIILIQRVVPALLLDAQVF